MTAKLVWEKDDGTHVEFPLTAEVTTIGRDETADVVIDENLVSRLHARIERRGERYVVIDLGSTNLTRVNTEPVVEKELSPGDELRFARARCRFEA
jgi:pSer/pThr/pTyr-binding forkhead associated (FHA) protein